MFYLTSSLCHYILADAILLSKMFIGGLEHLLLVSNEHSDWLSMFIAGSLYNSWRYSSHQENAYARVTGDCLLHQLVGIHCTG